MQCLWEHLPYLAGLLVRLAADLALPRWVEHYWRDHPGACPRDPADAATGQVPDAARELLLARQQQQQQQQPRRRAAAAAAAAPAASAAASAAGAAAAAVANIAEIPEEPPSVYQHLYRVT